MSEQLPQPREQLEIPRNSPTIETTIGGRALTHIQSIQPAGTRAAAIAKTTHGQSGTRLYGIWKAMRRRCDDRNSKNYGGRGIKVCARWDSFQAFYDDMGAAYDDHVAANPGSRNTSIERKNNDGDYEPSNCTWATRQEQSNNRRPRRDTKLTPMQVVNILHCKGSVYSTVLGGLYGVSAQSISDIWNGKSWRQLEQRLQTDGLTKEIAKELGGQA